MQQKWWLVAAGVVGIALAILLFPKPENDRLPEPDLTNANPLDFKGNEKPKPTQIRVARREPVSSDRLKARAARLPGMGHLTTPEAIYSGRLSGPWTLVRRQLLAHGDEDAKAWAEKVTPVVVDLRSRRRDPAAVDWDDLRSRQEALLEELRAHQAWMDIEGMAAQVDRIDDLMVGYDEAKEAQARGEPIPGAPPSQLQKDGTMSPMPPKPPAPPPTNP